MRKIATPLAEGSGAVYGHCKVCGKMKPVECGTLVKASIRWYCSEACRRKGERMYNGGRRG